MIDNSVHIILLTARTISERNDAFWTAADAIDLLFPLPTNLPNFFSDLERWKYLGLADLTTTYEKKHT